MVRPRLKGEVTSIKIADIKEELENAIKQGYTIKQLLKIGLKVVNTKDSLVKRLVEDYELLNDIRRSIEGLKMFIEGVSSLTPVLNNLINQTKSLSADIERASEVFNKLKDEHKKNIDLYAEAFGKINSKLNELLSKYEASYKTSLIEKINELDELRKNIINKFNLPASDPDLEKMAITIAYLKKILNE